MKNKSETLNNANHTTNVTDILNMDGLREAFGSIEIIEVLMIL